MSIPTAPPTSAPTVEPVVHETYVPGYVLPKIFIACLGLVLIGLSMIKFGPLAIHLATGTRTQAESVRVVRVSMGGEEQVLRTNREIEAITKDEKEKRNRNFIFWNEFRFTTPDGKEVEFRFPVGQYLAPHYLILDKDGVPATVPVWYDPANPTSLSLPGEWFTWFLPGTLLVFGLLTLWVGLTLLYYARKPIELPDLRKAHLEKETRRLAAAGHH